MKKSYKIILYSIGFFIIIGAVFAIVTGLFSSNPQNPQNNQNANGNQTATTTPILQLNSQEEDQVRQFVKNFTQLYNSYSYGDYSNLTALGDYQTQAMQQKTLDTIASLQGKISEGFTQTAEPDMASFVYSYSGSDTLTVTVNVKLTQTSSGSDSSPRNPRLLQTNVVRDVLTLKSYGQNWIVDDIQVK